MKMSKNHTNNKSAGLIKRSISLIVLLNLSFGAFAAQNAESVISDTMVVYILVGMIVLQIALLYVIAGVYKSLTGNLDLWKRFLPGTKSKAGILGLLMLTGNQVFAQGEESGFVLDSSLEMLLISINAFLVFIVIALLYNIRLMLNALKSEKEEEAVVEQDVFVSLGLTDAVPIEREQEILLDHAYDGIHELDNNLPPWWLYGFYITVFAMLGYMWYYLIQIDSHIGHNEFVAELKAAEAEAALRVASVDENSVTLLTSASDLAAGKEIFTTNCVACHLASGGGSVGPNLTDEYWLHGGGIKNVFRTIKVGVPEKGMISWEDQISPSDMQKVASYVLSLQGTNPADGKAPEGDKWAE